MRRISMEQRRRLLVGRHRLAGDAVDPEAVTRSLVALHATDPATVYLSLLARCVSTTLDDVSAALYDRRSLVRWMAMRRTLFLIPREDVPMVQAAVSTPLAAVLHRRLVGQLERNGSEPPVPRDIPGWLASLEEQVERALIDRGTATGAQLRADVPELATLIPARAPSDRPQHVTTSLLTLMSADGRLVRGTPTGPWTSRHHRWEPVSHWWPDGLPAVDPAEAERQLAYRWLTRYGPATPEDLQWWTGWTKTTTARALSRLPVEVVDLHGRPGLDLADVGDDDVVPPAPTATLLPALDPTPMGWRHRDWFLGVDPAQLFDRAGNIGPTLWWNGEIIGAWAVTRRGDVRTTVLTDRGREATESVDRAADTLQRRLGGAVVTPAARTPLEKSLSADDSSAD